MISCVHINDDDGAFSHLQQTLKKMRSDNINYHNHLLDTIDDIQTLLAGESKGRISIK